MRILILVLLAWSVLIGQVQSEDRFYVEVKEDGSLSSRGVKRLYLQQTHAANPNAWGILIELADGRTLTLNGPHALSALEAKHPGPVAYEPTIKGLTTKVGETLTLEYDYLGFTDDEGATAIEWTIGGQTVSTSSTYTTKAEDDGKTLRVTVTPKSNAGRVGKPDFDEALLSFPQPPAGAPYAWTAPDWFMPALDVPHPRGPGARGPKLADGRLYHDAIAGTALGQQHIAKAMAWDPMSGGGQNAPNAAMDVALAWLINQDPALLAKANAYLDRFDTPTSRPAGGSWRWSWATAAILRDHLPCDPVLVQKASAVILTQLEDVGPNSDRAGLRWGELGVWEGSFESSQMQFYFWTLLVFYDSSNPRWVGLAQWFKTKWYEQISPWLWWNTVGEWPAGPNSGGSWPQQSYWASNVGGHVYHHYLALNVAMGGFDDPTRDHFTVPELGGWYGLMPNMIRHRQAPDGTDFGGHLQTNWWYNPTYAGYYYQGGFAHYYPLVFATKDPLGMWEAQQDGQTNPMKILSPPFSAFYDPNATATPRSQRDVLRFFPSHAVVRNGWNDLSSMFWWARGDSIGHHRRDGPGFGFWVPGDSEGGGYWACGFADTYGHGWGAEVVHRTQSRYNGCHFYAEADPVTQVRMPFRETSTTSSTMSLLNDGGVKFVQNPWDYRTSQTPPHHLPDPFADFWTRHAQYDMSESLDKQRGMTQSGVHFVTEVLDWSPSFRSWTTATPRHPNMQVGQRPHRLPERGWVQGIVWLDARNGSSPAVVIIDITRPLAGVNAEWHIHTSEPLTMTAPGLWHSQRHGSHLYREGGLSRSFPPARHASGNQRMVHGDLWLRSWLNGAPVEQMTQIGDYGQPFWVFDGGVLRGQPVELTGWRQRPYSGQTELLSRDGPETVCPYKSVSVAPQGSLQADWVTVMNGGPAAYDATLSGNAVTVSGGGMAVTVTIDPATWALSVQ